MKIVMAVVAVAVAVMLAGCATTTDSEVNQLNKSWAVCLDHGISDPQQCDSKYDGGGFPPTK